MVLGGRNVDAQLCTVALFHQPSSSGGIHGMHAFEFMIIGSIISFTPLFSLGVGPKMASASQALAIVIHHKIMCRGPIPSLPKLLPAASP